MILPGAPSPPSVPAPERPARVGTGGAGSTGPAGDGRRPGVALQASLEDFPLDVLVGLVAASKRSGVLDIDGSTPVVLHFADGDLCGGESVEDPTLRTLIQAAGSGRGNVRAIVEDHLVTALAATLIAGKGEARFVPGRADPDLSRHRFRLATIMQLAGERVEAWRVIADVIPSTDTVLQLAPDLPVTLDQVLIERADWQILSCLNGTRDVAAIVSMSGRSAFDVCSSLYRMVVLGVISVP